MQNLELFNEMTSFILLYLTLDFTNFISDEALEYNIGWIFICIMGFNICVHLYFMIRNTCRDCKKKCKEKQAKKRLHDAGKKPNKKPISEEEQNQL